MDVTALGTHVRANADEHTKSKIRDGCSLLAPPRGERMYHGAHTSQVHFIPTPRYVSGGSSSGEKPLTSSCSESCSEQFVESGCAQPSCGIPPRRASEAVRHSPGAAGMRVCAGRHVIEGVGISIEERFAADRIFWNGN